MGQGVTQCVKKRMPVLFIGRALDISGFGCPVNWFRYPN